MKFISIAYSLIILIECILFVDFFKWQQQAVYEFEQRQQDIQVNYAADAAVQEMLANGTHLGTDYATWRDMVLEPELALDTYIAVLLRNLGWADTEYNREDLIESSIPFFCVAVYDGYYMYMRQHEERTETVGGHPVVNTVYEMRWTPKLPYSAIEEAPLGSGKYTYYFYNLGGQMYGTFKEDGSVVKYNNIISKTGNGHGSLAMARSVVNQTLTEACNSAMFTGLEGNAQAQWFLPSSFSDWSNSNPVESPSVLTYMSNSSDQTQFDTVTFGIGGAKVDDAQFCICYSRGGQKLYTWADNRDSLPAGTRIERVTTTAKEAAEAGYFFDISFRR